MSRVDTRTPPSFDGVAPSAMEAQNYQAKTVPSSTTAERSSRSRVSRITDVVLRILSVLLSIIAFATMAADSKSSTVVNAAGNILTLTLKFSDYDSLKAIVAANVIVCAYSIAQALGALISIVAGNGLLPSPTSEYIGFTFDQIFTYFLLATSAAGAQAVNLTHDGFSNVWPSLCKGDGLSSFCNIAAASVSMSFLNFLVVGASAVRSGYYLAKHISRS